MGAPTGCVRKPRSSFSVVRFWARCLKCGHEFIAQEMVACCGGRGDACDKCGSKKYKPIRSLTPSEKGKTERDLSEFLASTLRGRIRKRSCKK